MFIIKIALTAPDGTRSEDWASGNTRRTVETAVEALTKGYELDGYKVERASGIIKP